MLNGIQVPAPARIRLTTEKGSVLIELVFSVVLLTVFFFAIAGTISLVRDYVYLHRIAREAAREAVLTGDTAAGYMKAEDLAKMYFPRTYGRVTVSLSRQDGYRQHSVTATASYPHVALYAPFIGPWEVNFTTDATFGWWDFSTVYE
ncbi:hypothetical protein MTAT_29680 [Moorella thermoacetica]|uniref:TadE-like protein n=1 Tax=Neomoorella thermoacetica TaxID=1525 RepID=A0AAC9MU41_NEOTH|nr:hypothetical protein [Moorella thermoacetica]AOQ23116.1 hypothetical protein Maut_00653 [Moorella thermoacetica]TYL07029.1 hypothetical protein MTAT_29680 [Moorella thermoacetica]